MLFAQLIDAADITPVKTSSFSRRSIVERMLALLRITNFFIAFSFAFLYTGKHPEAL